MTSHFCPVCSGTGSFSWPPGIAGDQQLTWSAGTGIVWEPTPSRPGGSSFAAAQLRWREACRVAGPWTAIGSYHAERRTVAGGMAAVIECNAAPGEQERWRWDVWPEGWDSPIHGPDWQDAASTKGTAQAAADDVLHAAGWALCDEDGTT